MGRVAVGETLGNRFEQEAERDFDEEIKEVDDDEDDVFVFVAVIGGVIDKLELLDDIFSNFVFSFDTEGGDDEEKWWRCEADGTRMGAGFSTRLTGTIVWGSKKVVAVVEFVVGAPTLAILLHVVRTVLLTPVAPANVIAAAAAAATD